MKTKPCRECGSNDIKLWDCGYSSFNPGGGECLDCGYSVEAESGCLPTQNDLRKIWNNGQTPNSSDKLKLEKSKTKKLRKQLRDAGIIPIV